MSDSASRRHAAPFDDLLGYHLRRASMLVMSDFSAALAPLRLKPADASILFMLAASPGITQSRVGETLGILRANMAPLIAALLKQGLIARRPVDGRSQALRLSAAGERTYQQIRAIAQAHEDRVFDQLTPAARKALIAQLKAIWEEPPGTASPAKARDALP